MQTNTDKQKAGEARQPVESTQYDSSEYDTEAIEIDRKYGNFSEDRLEDYRHENIVQASMMNGQFAQAKRQCASYGLNYELEKYKFDNQ